MAATAKTINTSLAGQMVRIIVLISFVLLQLASTVSAERIKRKPPTEIEAARIASDQAMSDGMLQIGDVIVTDRGFYQFRGLAPDGSSEFLAIPNPLLLGRDKFRSSK
jgi:hypothetical protein